MRHGKKFNHLGRKSAHRKAMLSNMAASLIIHKRIKTTVAKAKALRVYVEPLITKSKTDTTHSRRVVFSYLQNKEAVKELFGEIRDKILDRPGGYTRILKTGNRLGDNAEMAMIELVDFNEYDAGKKGGESRKSRRRRRGRGKTKAAETAAAPVVEDAVEEVVEEQSQVEETTEVVEDVVEETTDEAGEEGNEVAEEEETREEDKGDTAAGA